MVIAEVYTLNTLFISLVVLVLLVWRDKRENRYLLAAAFLTGLSLTHHVTSGLLLPTAALFVLAVDRRKLLEWRLVLKRERGSSSWGSRRPSTSRCGLLWDRRLARPISAIS